MVLACFFTKGNNKNGPIKCQIRLPYPVLFVQYRIKLQNI